MLVYFNRILKYAMSSLGRNGWLSLVAVFIMTQALLIISIFASLNVVIGASINAINDRIDVAVFFKETVAQDQALAMKDKVLTWDGVRDVKYVSPQEALQRFLEDHRHKQSISEVISENENFLPASLEIKVDDPYMIEQIVAQVRAADSGGIISETSLEDNQKLIERLRNVGSFIQRSSLLLALVFVIIAILIIFNTIRITIFARKEEIEIMKLVGATDWYIRWPFIIEGMLYGVIGAIAAFLLMLAGWLFLNSNLGSQYLSLDALGSPTTIGPLFALQIFLLQLLFGVVVGAVSSYLSTKKHLH